MRNVYTHIMKGLWLILVILIALGLWAVSRGNSPASSGTTEEWLTYADPEGVFAFQYPEGWEVSGRDKSVMATISAPDNTKMIIRWSNQESDIRNCSGTLYDGDCWMFEYPEISPNTPHLRRVRESFRYLVNSD